MRTERELVQKQRTADDDCKYCKPFITAYKHVEHYACSTANGHGPKQRRPALLEQWPDALIFEGVNKTADSDADDQCTNNEWYGGPDVGNEDRRDKSK